MRRDELAKEYCSVTEAAKIIGISRFTVYKKLKRKTLEGMQIGYTWYVKREAAERAKY